MKNELVCTVLTFLFSISVFARNNDLRNIHDTGKNDNRISGYFSETFNNLTDDWIVQISGVTEDLTAVKAVSRTVAWMAGYNGTVLRTTDRGQNWQSVGGGSIGTANIYHLEALDEYTAFVTTTPNVTLIYRTTDGGISWQQVYTQTGGFIDAIYMWNATNGIAIGDPVGGKWTILNTTDGGASWYRIATEPNQVGSEAGWNNSLAVINNNIWFGTNNTRIYRSTDAGLTWTFATTPALNSHQVDFLDSINGVSGYNSGICAYTTNGGSSWIASGTIPGGTFQISALGKAGMDNIWIGKGINVYRSTDRGVNWISTPEYISFGSIYALDFVEYDYGTQCNGWLGDASGSIARYQRYPDPNNIDNQFFSNPNDFILYPNYPNPFNPSTVISYQLPVNSKVSLKIYNLLGQEIRTLVNGTQSTGLQTIQWDGKDNRGQAVSSGVYFYRLETPGFTKTMKMMMMR